MASFDALLDTPDNDEGFSKSRRLLDSASFKPVFSNTQFRVSCAEFLVLAILRSNPEAVNTAQPCGNSRLGMVIAKKHVKHSVDRNRIKRLIREYFRQARHQLPSMDIVVLARANAGSLSKSECTTKLAKLFNSLARKADVTQKASNVA